MIRIALVGDIGSGKTHIAKLFRYPVFNADLEVSKIYKNDKKCFKDIKKKITNFEFNFPIKKKQLIRCISFDPKNLIKISSVVHPIVRKKLNLFLKKNNKRRYVILDIPLFFENKINKKKDIIIFIQANKDLVKKKLKKRNGFDKKLLKLLKKIQLPLHVKKKKSHFILKNNFSNKSAKSSVKYILDQI